MNITERFNAKNTLELVGLKKNFDFLKSLLMKDKLPKVTLLTGEKGIGKSTMINHLMYFFFDKENYDQDKYTLLKKSSFYKQYFNDLFPDIIYLDGSILNNIKIEDIRNLKEKIFKTSINNKKRFVILDDVETFNTNSLNALLKVIEEPSNNNFFILINNKTKPILETIKSRCLEIKILISNETRLEVSSFLINYYNQKLILNENKLFLSPGNFIKFNYIIAENKIDINDSFLNNLSILINLYKKEKDMFYKDLLVFFTEYYINQIKRENLSIYEKFINNKLFIIKNINNFFLYKLNQNTLINSIENRLNE